MVHFDDLTKAPRVHAVLGVDVPPFIVVVVEIVLLKGFKFLVKG